MQKVLLALFWIEHINWLISFHSVEVMLLYVVDGSLGAEAGDVVEYVRWVACVVDFCRFVLCVLGGADHACLGLECVVCGRAQLLGWVVLKALGLHGIVQLLLGLGDSLAYLCR